MSAQTHSQASAEAQRLQSLLGRRDSRVHFVGVGGVGMAGLAFQLHRRGARVTGTDAGCSRVTAWLRTEGVAVQQGHRTEAVPADADWVVRTPAVADTNVELQVARARGLPVFSRGAVLAALFNEHRGIAVGGTHGKTTTTAMILHLLRAGGMDPSGCVGGELDEHGTVAVAGTDGWFVTEADESDGTLALYQPEIGIITNIEFDHMDYFPDEASFRACFEQFASGTRSLLLHRGDEPASRQVAALARRAVSFGPAPAATVAVSDVRADRSGSDFVLCHPAAGRHAFRVPLPGLHNVWNAAAALAAAWECGVRVAALVAGLASFRSVRRRFEIVLDAPGCMVVSDYAHHPTEIRAVLDAARRQGRRMVAVYQPHRYTRTRTLAAEFPSSFDGLAHLVLAPVYAASEAPLDGGTSADLVRHFRPGLHVPVELAESLDDAWARAVRCLREGDMFLILGAGDVEQLAVRARDEWAGRFG